MVMATVILICLGFLVFSYILFKGKITDEIKEVEGNIKSEIKSVETEALGYLKDGIDKVKTNLE